jgi:hypothetical protein
VSSLDESLSPESLAQIDPHADQSVHLLCCVLRNYLRTPEQDRWFTEHRARDKEFAVAVAQFEANAAKAALRVSERSDIPDVERGAIRVRSRRADDALAAIVRANPITTVLY